MPKSEVWQVYRNSIGMELGLIERFDFYECTENAYAVSGPLRSGSMETCC